jgi:transcriptional regulator GlxA family with amidase domain
MGPKSKVSSHLPSTRDELKDRWVVSNRFWTSSGVTAGIDMAAAFVRYWIELHVGAEEGKVISDDLLGVTEVMYVSSRSGQI